MRDDVVFFRETLVEIEGEDSQSSLVVGCREMRERTDHSWSSIVLCCHLYSRPSDALNFLERDLCAGDTS